MQFDIRDANSSASAISVQHLPTPVDVYLPLDEARLDLSYFKPVLVTESVTSLVGVKIGASTNVAIKVLVQVADVTGLCVFLLMLLLSIIKHTVQ